MSATIVLSLPISLLLTGVQSLVLLLPLLVVKICLLRHESRYPPLKGTLRLCSVMLTAHYENHQTAPVSDPCDVAASLDSVRLTLIELVSHFFDCYQTKC